MRIVKISGHACIRVSKMALALIEKGHKVDIISKRVPYYGEFYNSYTSASSVRNYLDAIKMYEPYADIFHAHNEPSWFVTAVKEITDKPVVLDIHDSYLMRLTADEEFEMKE
jgi:hypothetical protein